MNLNYTVTSRTKQICFALMGLGILSIIGLYVTDSTAPEGFEEYHHNRFWANLLTNGIFFLGIGLLATFFLAVQYAAEVAWSAAVKRILEAVSEWLMYGVGIMVVLLILGRLGVHHLYHWMDQDVYNEASPKFDEVINGKKGYFADWFFWLRTITYAVMWVWFQKGFRKRSLEEDLHGGIAIHNKNILKSALFLLFFGVTSSTAAWDWIMSIDVHWFSTMFGWYTFAGWWVSSLTVITLFVVYLKSKGYLEFVNDSHIHDLGKWMFAISFLWSYLWFMQFMLIWYTNIPEEVTYYYDRMHDFGYRWVMWGMFAVNLIFPMTMLISRDAKRNKNFLIVAGVIILVGHWIDNFNMVMPASVHEHWHLGLYELGIALGFLGAMLYVIHNALAKAPLLVKHHPYLDETLHHHT